MPQPNLTRRELLALLAAPQQYPGVAYRDYSRCLPDYLRELASRAYEKRNADLEKLKTPADIAARQKWVSETFWRLTGGMPERTSLNARVTGSFERDGYKVERVLYESRPNLHIPANLYIPTRMKPPFPGVLFQMGHTLNGKAGDTYQRCCQGLAKLGYLVLGFDPMGQGERTYYPGAELSRTRFGSADDEHTVPGKQMLLLGDTSTRMQVWDAVRSLDYLAAHPLVDPKRLASTGQSGGGTVTMLLLAVDDRLAAAVVCCGNTENFACANFNPPGSTDDAEQNFLNSGPAGFDRWDLLYPFAPKPLLVTVSDKDFFGTYSSRYISSGWEEFQKLARIYAAMGAGDRISWEGTPLPHGLQYDTRLRVYNWFARWLKSETREITEEPPVALEPERTLFVSASGNVVHSLRGETPFSLNAKRAVERTPAKLESLLGVEPEPSNARATILRRAVSRGLDVEALEIPSASKVWLPAWLFLPRKPRAEAPVLLVIEPSGRNVNWHEDELYWSLASEGIPVCVPDVRGVGDLTPEFSRGAARYARSHNSEEHYAWASLMLGKPLVGQRVTDILSVAKALRAHPALAGRPLTLAARARMTVPALFSAALDANIGRVYLNGGLASFRGIVDTEGYDHAFANFVPRLLLHTDLPAVAAALAPRRLVLAGTLNGAGKPMNPAEARRLYAQAPNVEVRPAEAWSLETLRRM